MEGCSRSSAERFREITQDQIAVLISHRFSAVRMADAIVVLDAGRVVEARSHEELLAHQDRYEQLFSLQAQGYQ